MTGRCLPLLFLLITEVPTISEEVYVMRLGCKYAADSDV